MSKPSVAARIYRNIPLRREMLLALRRVGAPRVAYRLYFDGPFPVRVDETHAFLLCQPNRWGVETAIFWQGLEAGWEPQSVAAWVTLCRGAQVILDVGAAEGLYALIAKCLRPNATVMAFEPFGPRHRELLRNVHLNGFDIACPRVAISNFIGVSDFVADGVHSHRKTVANRANGRRRHRRVCSGNHPG
jgi:hypothetical protein